MTLEEFILFDPISLNTQFEWVFLTRNTRYNWGYLTIMDLLI